MNKTRLETFSDGVLAIIIMILEMKIPHGGNFSDLVQVIPAFVSYLLSFVFIGIYWGNHHHMLHTVKHVNSGIMLANLHLLFWLSMVPFVTGWMGENHFEPATVALYSAILDICGVAYFILHRIILNSFQLTPAMEHAMKKQSRKGILSVILYTSSIPLAFVHPLISGALIILTAIIWLIPDKNIERAMGE